MNSINANDGSVWVIKDQDGNYANRNSIGKLDDSTWAYIGFKTFGAECKGDTNSDHAQGALKRLNEVKTKSEFDDIIFHLEYSSLHEMTKVNKAFQGDNMIFIEKKIPCVLHQKKFPYSLCNHHQVASVLILVMVLTKALTIAI